MDLKRLFSSEHVKGTRLYLDTQRKYEIARTVLYFAISFGIFIAGYITTGTRKNLLTIVAVLGMLPASKSLVSVIMFCRFKSFREAFMKTDVLMAYDMVFTSEKKNYQIDHLCVADSCVVCFTLNKDLDENAFKDHVLTYLGAEKIDNVTVKVFKDKNAYLNRIGSLGKAGGKDRDIFMVLQQIVL